MHNRDIDLDDLMLKEALKLSEEKPQKLFVDLSQFEGDEMNEDQLLEFALKLSVQK